MRNSLITGLALAALLAVSPLWADSELDAPQKKAPAFIVSKLDPKTKTITNYKVDRLPAGLSQDALAKLSASQRGEALKGFFATVARPENQISQEKAVAVASELDNARSTGATYYRWSGGYYGGGFYYNDCYNPVYYRPVWDCTYDAGFYGSVGYYRGPYGGSYTNVDLYGYGPYGRGYADINVYRGPYGGIYANADAYYTLYGW